MIVFVTQLRKVTFLHSKNGTWDEVKVLISNVPRATPKTVLEMACKNLKESKRA